MNKLQMPSSYAALTAEEQQEVCGGGEFQDAVNNFFDNLHLDDFFYGDDLVSISISFVPMLLFRMVKLGVQTGIVIYNEVTSLVQQVVDSITSALKGSGSQQQASTTQPVQQTNGFTISTFPGMLK